LAANVDQAILVVTVVNPQTSTTFIDRFLASAEAYRVPVVLVFNKTDLLDEDTRRYQEAMVHLYQTIGYECYQISAETGAGVETLQPLLKDKITLLSGNSGVGKSTLKMLLQDKSETKIKFIKEKLYGLIIVEYYMEEEIFRIDSSFKYLIEQIINNDRNLMIFNNIFKNYFKCFRMLLDEDNIKGGFHACIDNNFWFGDEVKKLFKKSKREINAPKFVCDIDSNNIYHFIKNNSNDIYNDIDIRAYIDDISISLPTILYFTNNFYYEYLIIDVFEKFYESLKAKENTLKINELILRLGIFKYWVSKNPSFFEKSLKSAGITDKLNIMMMQNLNIIYQKYMIALLKKIETSKNLVMNVEKY
jgi:hypothetical protein